LKALKQNVNTTRKQFGHSNPGQTGESVTYVTSPEHLTVDMLHGIRDVLVNLFDQNMGE
jgi:hypothetical protein